MSHRDTSNSSPPLSPQSTKSPIRDRHRKRSTKKREHFEHNEDLLSAIDLGVKQADDLDIDRTSDAGKRTDGSTDEGESSGEELDDVFTRDQNHTTNEKSFSSSDSSNNRISNTKVVIDRPKSQHHSTDKNEKELSDTFSIGRSNDRNQIDNTYYKGGTGYDDPLIFNGESTWSNEEISERISKTIGGVSKLPVVDEERTSSLIFSKKSKRVNESHLSTTMESRGAVGASGMGNPLSTGKRLVRERRLELLQQRRAKRELRSRKQIDRQIKAQARETETNTDRSALQYSGWGVDHGYTGVAFSATAVTKANKDKTMGRNSIGQSSSRHTFKKISTKTDMHQKKRSFEELETLEAKIAEEMQRSYDALRRMRGGPTSKDSEMDASKETQNVLVISFRLPFKLQKDGNSWVARAWQNVS